MNKRQRTRIISILGIAAIGIIAIVMISAQLDYNNRIQEENRKSQEFIISYNSIVNESRSLTQGYQEQIGKWQNKEYDNATMIEITDTYIPRFHGMVEKLQAIETPQRYENVRDLSIRSFELEIESYRHFKNFLLTGNPVDDKKSIELLSESLKYESDAFAALKSME